MSGLLFSTQINAQAIVDHESQYLLTLDCDVDLLSTSNLHVITPSGNVTYNFEFQLSECNMYIPDKGVNKTPWEQWLEGVWVTGHAWVNSNGKCKFILHGQIEP